MPIEFREDLAVFIGEVSVQEAEPLLEWLQSGSAGSRRRLDLGACTHLHSADLQVLMAAQPTVSKWPDDPSLAAWMRSALRPGGVEGEDSNQGGVL